MRAVQTWIVVLLSVALSACVPTVLVVDPGWRFAIVDEAGAPVAGAEVTVVRWSFPHQSEAGVASRLSDADGVAQFDQSTEVGVWALVLGHGPTANSWTWCVRKDGRTTQVSEQVWRRNEVQQPIDVVLSAGPESGGCTADELRFRG